MSTLSQSPLAAKVVGNQLRKLNSFFLLSTFCYVFIDVPVLLIFANCHKGYRYTAATLVRVALDFLQPEDDNRNVEDIGLEYLHMMVAITRSKAPVYVIRKWRTAFSGA